MQYSPGAVKAGVGMFAAFGVGIGLLMYFIIDSSVQSGAGEEFGMIFAISGLIVTLVLSPILATIVGAIIAKNFDDEGDAAFNGAIVGVAGTVVMVFVAMFFWGMAVDDVDDIDGLGIEEIEDEASDSIVKGLIPAAVGGALGAFVGFRYLWAQLPHSEMHSVMHPPSPPQVPPASPPQF